MSEHASSGFRAMDICARKYGEALARMDEPDWKPKYRDPSTPPPHADSERLRRAGRIACGLRTNQIIEAGFLWHGPAAEASHESPSHDPPPDRPPVRRLWAVGGGDNE